MARTTDSTSPVGDAQPSAPIAGTDLGQQQTETAKTDDAVTAAKGDYKVAPGRTVDGKKPGDTVSLDDGDATRLLELGFILDKDGAVVVRADGPAVNVEDGIQIKTSV